eukprot:4790334-Amphidinium_carterae.1
MATLKCTQELSEFSMRAISFHIAQVKKPVYSRTQSLTDSSVRQRQAFSTQVTPTEKKDPLKELAACKVSASEQQVCQVYLVPWALDEGLRGQAANVALNSLQVAYVSVALLNIAMECPCKEWVWKPTKCKLNL